MRLADHSALRPPGAEPVEIPLNGVTYWARPEVPVESILVAIGSSTPMDAITAQLEAAGVTDLQDTKALERLTKTNPMLVMKVSSMGLGRIDRALIFMQQALEPESLQRWVSNSRPLPVPSQDASPEEVEAYEAAAEAHKRTMISTPQLLAVFQDLIAYYNARPTEASSSSPAGADATIGTSTAMPQPAVAPTPWTLPHTATAT